MLWTDKGKEFYNQNVTDALKDNNKKLYSTENEEKSSIVERFNSTIKKLMSKMFSASDNAIYWENL